MDLETYDKATEILNNRERASTNLRWFENFNTQHLSICNELAEKINLDEPKTEIAKKWIAESIGELKKRIDELDKELEEL